MDYLSRILQRLGIEIAPKQPTRAPIDAGPREDVLDPTDFQDGARQLRDTMITDGNASSGVLRMNAYTPGGICNPAITYGDLRRAPTSLVPLIDGRYESPKSLPRPIEMEGPTPVKQLFLPVPSPREYEKTENSDF